MRDTTGHPLSFLASVSPEGLSGRARTWRDKGLAFAGEDVAGSLEDAAAVLRLVQAAVEGLLAKVEAGRRDARDDVAATRVELDAFDRADVERFRRVGRRLRTSGADPHGGSTSAHLERASDEITHVLEGLDRMVTLAEEGADMEDVREEALRALRRAPKRATHDAPAMRM